MDAIVIVEIEEKNSVSWIPWLGESSLRFHCRSPATVCLRTSAEIVCVGFGLREHADLTKTPLISSEEENSRYPRDPDKGELSSLKPGPGD